MSKRPANDAPNDVERENHANRDAEVISLRKKVASYVLRRDDELSTNNMHQTGAQAKGCSQAIQGKPTTVERI